PACVSSRLLGYIVSPVPRPPSSSHFPYTTLFRSQLAAGLAEVIKYGVIGDPDLLQFVEDRLDQLAAGDRAALLRIVARSCEIKADRKSTRLNSSHVKISYAVFCLKKKTYDERRGG